MKRIAVLFVKFLVCKFSLQPLAKAENLSCLKPLFHSGLWLVCLLWYVVGFQQIHIHAYCFVGSILCCKIL